jgi:hypothetical protein
MASSGKRKTTMTKLAREGRLRERRAAKAARKDARKNAPPEELIEPGAEVLEGEEAEIVEADAEETVPAAVGATLTDA